MTLCVCVCTSPSQYLSSKLCLCGKPTKDIRDFPHLHAAVPENARFSPKSYRYRFCSSWFEDEKCTRLSADAHKCPLYVPVDPCCKRRDTLNFLPLARDFYSGGCPAPPRWDIMQSMQVSL